jgi:hypothetical protein
MGGWAAMADCLCQYLITVCCNFLNGPTAKFSHEFWLDYLEEAFIHNFGIWSDRPVPPFIGPNPVLASHGDSARAYLRITQLGTVQEAWNQVYPEGSECERTELGWARVVDYAWDFWRELHMSHRPFRPSRVSLHRKRLSVPAAIQHGFHHSGEIIPVCTFWWEKTFRPWYTPIRGSNMMSYSPAIWVWYVVVHPLLMFFQIIIEYITDCNCCYNL